MSDSSDDYTLEDAQDEVGILRRVTDDVVEANQNAESEDVLEFLIEDENSTWSTTESVVWVRSDGPYLSLHWRQIGSSVL